MNTQKLKQIVSSLTPSEATLVKTIAKQRPDGGHISVGAVCYDLRLSRSMASALLAKLKLAGIITTKWRGRGGTILKIQDKQVWQALARLKV